jgi:transcriptional regulator GlxA family with amidase domain
MPQLSRQFLARTTLALFITLALGGPSSAMPAAEMNNDLEPPDKGKINVAFVIGNGATVIDFTGPWEVFQDVHVEGRGKTHDATMPFNLYTVAASTQPVKATGGLQLIPDYSFDDAPQPHVIVVPAVPSSPAMLAWLKKAGATTDVTMSVCTGAFILAKAGLLDGLQATTHHQFSDELEKKYPEVIVKRGRRYVENADISSAGGLTSGIDLALHVVDRYFGAEVAARTAAYMEYESDGWRLGEASRKLANELSSH